MMRRREVKGGSRIAPSVWSAPSSRNCVNPYELSSKNSISYLWKFLPCVVLMLIPWMPTRCAGSVLNNLKFDVFQSLREQKKLVKEIDGLSREAKGIKDDIERLERENERTFRELQRQGIMNVDAEDENYQQVEALEDKMIQRIDEMESEIQESSKKQVIAKYGDEEILVEVCVREEKSSRRSTFVIKLASVEEMPHSVHHFLQMVELQLWDGLSFVHGENSDVVIATPMVLSSHEWVGKRFVEANLTQMAFTEFSESYPPPHHHKYSVAFSGRPGGPDFYISLEEDLTDHDHESVFGVVSEGREVIDRFFSKKQKRSSKTDLMNIVSIRVLT